MNPYRADVILFNIDLCMYKYVRPQYYLDLEEGEEEALGPAKRYTRKTSGAKNPCQLGSKKLYQNDGFAVLLLFFYLNPLLSHF